jgi:hypothetical protein
LHRYGLAPVSSRQHQHLPLSLSLSLSLMVGLTYDCARVSIVVSCHVSIDNPSPHGGRRQRERGNGVPANARPWRKTFGRSDTPLMCISSLRCTRLQPSGVDILGEGEGFLGVEGKFLSIGRHYFVGDADPRLDDATVANIYIYIYIYIILIIYTYYTYIYTYYTYIYIHLHLPQILGPESILQPTVRSRASFLFGRSPRGNKGDRHR